MIKIGLTFCFLVLFFLITTYRSKKRKNDDVDISKYSNKILVNLEECEIISGSVTQKDNPYVNIMNIGGSLHSLLSESNDTQSSTYLRYFYNDMEFIAGPLAISSFGVKAACLEKKTTYIYYNKLDDKDYYFDVNFILS